MYNGPKVEMTFEEFGRDGNIFAISGTVTRAMKDQLDIPPEELDASIKEYRYRIMDAKSYQEALSISTEYVEFIDDDSCCEECGCLLDECSCDEICVCC